MKALATFLKIVSVILIIISILLAGVIGVLAQENSDYRSLMPGSVVLWMLTFAMVLITGVVDGISKGNGDFPEL